MKLIDGEYLHVRCIDWFTGSLWITWQLGSGLPLLNDTLYQCHMATSLSNNSNSGNPGCVITPGPLKLLSKDLTWWQSGSEEVGVQPSMLAAESCRWELQLDGCCRHNGAQMCGCWRQVQQSSWWLPHWFCLWETSRECWKTWTYDCDNCDGRTLRT